MDSAFNLTPDLAWGTGRLQPYAIQPCPVEDLLKAYLPDWLIAFLADMWQWVSVRLTCNIPFFIFFYLGQKRCHLGWVPSLRRGTQKSFDKIELAVGDREFSWLFEYLKEALNQPTPK